MWTGRFKRDADSAVKFKDRIVALGYDPSQRVVVALGWKPWQRLVALAALLMLGCATWAVSRTGTDEGVFDHDMMPPASPRPAGG